MAGIRRRNASQSWFGRDSCLVRRGERRELVVRGARVASWKEGETAIRNVMLVQLAQEPGLVLEDIAKAFHLSSETLRLIRRKAEKEGILAVMLRPDRDARAIAPELRQRMEGLFAQGLGVKDVFRAMDGRVALSTVSKYRREWLMLAPEVLAPAVAQQSLPLAETSTPAPVAQAVGAADLAEKLAASAEPAAVSAGDVPAIRAPRGREESEYRARLPSGEEPTRADTEDRGWARQIRSSAPRSRSVVQHLGVWLLTAVVASKGLHDKAGRVLREGKVEDALRVALDAVIAALGIGQGCVEGVRRLSTGTGAALLLSSSVPSATWVRRTLGQAAPRSTRFQDQLAAERIREVQLGAFERPAVFYVDNHTRAYTGRHKLTWHWKMQEDRAVPGVTDYWIHDGDGRPITALTAYQQGSMVEYLPRCAQLIRGAMGRPAPALVVFDRGGAFPTAMVELKDLPGGGVDFLTYERAPYRRYGREYFEKHGAALWRRDAADKRERLVLLDRGAYLGQGRGRVRRLALLMPDDEQINLLTSSQEDARWLMEVLFSRWRQENAFKHGAERWGLNQLDSRQVEHYAPETIIPNPYHASLEQSRTRAVEREGRVRCRLARLRADAPERNALQAKLAETVDMLGLLKAALRRTKRHVALGETHLAGKLVHHKKEYKLLVDAIRVACINAESELAGVLASNSPRAEEAKRVLQNVFTAPGSLRVGPQAIAVTLDPSANRAEVAAIDRLLAHVTAMKLAHPGDPLRRPLRFGLKTPASPQGA